MTPGTSGQRRSMGHPRDRDLTYLVLGSWNDGDQQDQSLKEDHGVNQGLRVGQCLLGEEVCGHRSSTARRQRDAGVAYLLGVTQIQRQLPLAIPLPSGDTLVSGRRNTVAYGIGDWFDHFQSVVGNR